MREVECRADPALRRAQPRPGRLMVRSGDATGWVPRSGSSAAPMDALRFSGLLIRVLGRSGTLLLAAIAVQMLTEALISFARMA